MIDKLILYAKGFFRAFPCLIIVISILCSLIFQMNILLFFGIFKLVTDYLAHYLKYLTEYLYKLYGNDVIPILGLGKRPLGAKHCGCFVYENGDGLSKSFGMPSGHSISAMTTAMFWSMYIIENYPNNYKRTISLLVLNFTCLMVGVSRIYLGCHTVQHVIVGSIIGLLFGFVGYKIYKLIKSSLKI